MEICRHLCKTRPGDRWSRFPFGQLSTVALYSLRKTKPTTRETVMSIQDIPTEFAMQHWVELRRPFVSAYFV